MTARVVSKVVRAACCFIIWESSLMTCESSLMIFESASITSESRIETEAMKSWISSLTVLAITPSLSSSCASLSSSVAASIVSVSVSSVPAGPKLDSPENSRVAPGATLFIMVTLPCDFYCGLECYLGIPHEQVTAVAHLSPNTSHCCHSRRK